MLSAHATDIVEHPELVADAIIAFAKSSACAGCCAFWEIKVASAAEAAESRIERPSLMNERMKAFREIAEKTNV